MTRNWCRVAGCLASVISLLLVATLPISAQRGAPDGEWRTYGADFANTRYAALDQINAGNFSELEVAWRFKTDNLGPRREFYFQSTPLVAGGVLYSTGGTRRAVFALDAATGELLWVHRLDEGERGAAAPRRLSGRGLAYWTDGSDERIVYVTPGYRLIALDAKTGRRLSGFGDDGIVDLRQEDDQVIDPVVADIGLHAAPIIVKNVIVVGASHSANNPAAGVVTKSRSNVKGFVRGYDVRTGRRLWIFHTIPTADEFGIDTWLSDSWSYTGNTGAWSQMSADEELGHVYVPTESATNDFYGGHRPGDNLFANSLVALDVETGTLTFPARPSWPTSQSTAGRSKRSPSPPSRGGCTCSIGPTAARCGRSRSDLSRRATCRENGTRPRSRSRPNRPRLIARVLASTI